MSVVHKFIFTVSLIVVSLLAGYVLRRLRLAGERAAQILMTLVAVFGYSSVDLLAVWGNPPNVTDFWLPVMAAAQIGLMCLLGLLAGRWAARTRPERGLFSIASAAGNNGFTLGGFIVFLLMGQEGLSRVTMYGLAWTPMTVLLFYPVARHFASEGPPAPLGRLMLRSALNWRSIGLPITALGLTLGWTHVCQPGFVKDWHLVDLLMCAVIAMAYVAIGLRLHVSDILSMRRMLAAVAGMRFVVGLGAGLALVSLVGLTPWPLSELSRKVFLIEAFVPTAVTMVAVANMFHLLPRQASVLFLVNTLMYLGLVLPFVLWFFGR